MQQASGCPCANPTAAGSPQAPSTLRPAAVVRRPQPPGRRSHRRRPDTSGRRSRRPAERIGGAAALNRQVDVSAIAEHLGHGAAVWVDGLGRSVTTEPTEPLLAVGGHFSRCGKLREILPACDGFRAFWAAPALMAVSPDRLLQLLQISVWLRLLVMPDAGFEPATSCL